jgi:hypothetical protein
VDVVEWSRALVVRLSEWCCSVSMVWVQINKYAILDYHSIEILCFRSELAGVSFLLQQWLLWTILRKVIRTIGLSIYWAFGLSGPRTIELSEYRTIWHSDYWAFGLSGGHLFNIVILCECNSSEFFGPIVFIFNRMVGHDE